MGITFGVSKVGYPKNIQEKGARDVLAAAKLFETWSLKSMMFLVLPSDLFGMVKLTPFKWLSDLQRSGMKFGHEQNHLGCHFFPGKNHLDPTRIFFPFLVGNPHELLQMATKF